MATARNPYDPVYSNAYDARSYDFLVGYPFGEYTDQQATKLPGRFNVDWLETASQHIITAEVPGMNKEDIKVQVEDGQALEISYERIRKKTEEADKWHRSECLSGKCMRKFALPDNAAADQVNARLENGLLIVMMGKKVNDKIKPVEIAG
uniref:SHSP domain-containing protein n=1 Tax=Kalanchoe fedtschenkoi TaxID=63787 RepID=A0A7N0UAH7_KALFE